MDETMYVTFVSLVLAFAVGFTAVGSVAFYMAERYDVAFVCHVLALFIWVPQMMMDIDEPIFLSGDLFLACYCFVMAITSDGKSGHGEEIV